MRAPVRLAVVVAAGVALALASSAVRGTRPEVQDWDCPPAPQSCARPVAVRGFPRPYISDFHGISVVGQASLLGAMMGEDHFHAADFWWNAAVYAGAVGVAWTLGRRVARRRRAG